MNVTPLISPPPAPPADPTPAITTAVDEALAVIGEAEELHRRLMALTLPRGGDPATRLRELQRLWNALGVGSPTRNSAERRAQLFIAKLENNKHLHANGVSLLLNRALDQIDELLSGGVNDDEQPVLSRRDFGTGLLTLQDGGLLAGRYDSLPDGHFAREWVAPEDCYSLNCPPCLVLSDVPKQREVFFTRSTVVALTRMWRTAQQRREAESGRVEQERVAKETERWEADQKIQVKVLQERVAQLEREKQEREKATATTAPAQ